MPKACVGSSITITVLVTDNSAEFNNPNGTPQPVPVQSLAITLYTPSGATPVNGALMTAAPTVGYYTYQYNSLPTDEIGLWFASFVAMNAGVTGIARKQPIFALITL